MPRATFILFALLPACLMGPNYVRPTVVVPSAYRESAEWKVVRPSDRESRGSWWQIFGDPELDGLARRATVANQTLAVSEAQLRQARAVVAQARAGYYPTTTLDPRASRTWPSTSTRGSGLTTAASTGVPTNVPSSTGKPVDFYSLPVDVSWELDFWGRVRRTVEANLASAEASAADLETARLSVQAQLAQAYFQLRTLDAQKQLLDQTITAYTQALTLTESRFRSGVASRADVVQAQAQLKTAAARAIDLGVQRAQLEHAIAVLLGQAPAQFRLAPAPLTATPPPIPVGLPSQLLERRPDIAAAERRMAAANAQIGVAVAGFFPSLTLNASGGFQSASLGDWLTWPSRFFSVGPAISQILFDGGLRSAQTQQARAAFDASVANYRQTVLTAFQAVEDNLAGLRILEDEARVQDEAVKASEESLALTLDQYKAGVVSYLNVITAQTIALDNETTAVQIRGRRMAAAVLLVQALGGGWHAGR
jgi:NodT family efflux transporter outer membrane factor (OMF) lipoprotein